MFDRQRYTCRFSASQTLSVLGSEKAKGGRKHVSVRFDQTWDTDKGNGTSDDEGGMKKEGKSLLRHTPNFDALIIHVMIAFTPGSHRCSFVSPIKLSSHGLIIMATVRSQELKSTTRTPP